MKFSIGKKLETKLKNCTDFIVQDMKVSENKSVKLYFIDNMIDKNFVSKEIVDKLSLNNLNGSITIEKILGNITVAGAQVKVGYQNAEEDVLGGSVVVFADWFDGNKYISAPCQGYKMRAVAEPPTSAVQRGPREGFTEDINTNISLIRRRLKSPDVVIEDMKLGKYTDTKIVISYISSIADKKVVKELKEKLQKINIDGIVDSFYVESLIAPKKSNLFKQIGNTEKPDVAVAKILEGRIAIIVDGSPIVLTVPYIFLEDLQSGDDYYGQAMHASFIRIIRVLGIIISITLPGVYVALQSFHYGILPIDFLISIQTSIEGLSFPPLIEILVVLFLFEILNEASIRMPKYSGMALSIVGALVLGDTAVQAGLISPPAVIMVAISGITLFTVPNQIHIASILRFLFTIIGGVTGFYGLLTAFMFLISYLMTLDAYGSPYFAPYAPNISQDKKDGFIKQRLDDFISRPRSIPNINKVRQRNDKNSN